MDYGEFTIGHNNQVLTKLKTIEEASTNFNPITPQEATSRYKQSQMSNYSSHK